MAGTSCRDRTRLSFRTSRPMDPAIVLFGFGIGLLVGMTGMGGASLMTPLLILIFKTQPVTAIGTDIFYAAVTKTVGGVQHLRAGTVHRGLGFWMAVGSVPAAIGGVFVIEILQDAYGEDSWRDRLRDPRRDPPGRRHLDPDADDLDPGRDQGAVRAPPPSPPHHRRGRDRADHRLRDRPDVGRVGDADRDHPDRRLPADAPAGRRHRHLPRGRSPLGGRPRSLGRRQRRLRPRRKHPARLDPRCPRRRQARAEGPARTCCAAPRDGPDHLGDHPDLEGDARSSCDGAPSPCFGIVFIYILRREVMLHGEGVRAYKLVSVPWTRTQGFGDGNGDDPAQSKEPTGYDPGFKE